MGIILPASCQRNARSCILALAAGIFVVDVLYFLTIMDRGTSQLSTNSRSTPEKDKYQPESDISQDSRDCNLDETSYLNFIQYRNMKVTKVLYNRVPKCGSETVRDLFRLLQSRNNFTWIECKHYLRWLIKEDEQDELTQEINRSKGSVVYDKHVYFINFPHFGLRSPVYINVVRDPVEWQASWYYYIRQFNDLFPMTQERRRMTYDECVAKDDPECTDRNSTFKVVPFFCGHDELCRYPNEGALEQAKRNVETYYAVVGFMEDLSGFCKAVEYLLPNLFRNMTDKFERIDIRKKKRYSNKTKQPIKPETRTKMEELLAIDYEFYYYLKERYRNLLCAIERSKKSS